MNYYVQPTLKRKELHKGENPRKEESLKALLEAAYDTR